MISKNKLKYIKSLHDKKFRNKYEEFLVEGEKSIEELLNSDFKIKEIFLSENFYKKIKNKINIYVEICSEDELTKASTFKNNNSGIAIVYKKKNILSEEIAKNTTLVLDDIKDPGNLGTIIRTADWYGVKNIVCSYDTCEVYNPKVIISTMGSFCRVNINYTDLEEYLVKQKISIYGAFLGGENLNKSNLDKNSIIIIGNESNGISKEVEKLVTKKITIPRIGGAESLNAGVATGIILNKIVS